MGSTYLGSDLPLLWGDANRIRQILINFVGNAIKFSDSGTILISQQIETVGEKRRLTIAVDDEGPGVQPSKVQSIFEEFVQADSSTQRRYGGSGLRTYYLT